MIHATQATARAPHVRLLAALLALFVFRVGAQLLQFLAPGEVLPPFAAWQSGALPYAVLLPAQLAIILAAAWAILRMAAGRTRPRRGLGKALLILGGLYMAGSVVRLALGLTALAGHPFFGALIPGAFHLVLAAMVLTFGHFHFTRSQRP